MRHSVIIPTLNEATTIGPTLRRVQCFAPYEIIVADGGSHDGTREQAGRYSMVVNGRRGRGAQLNAGAAAASGDTLVFLHADVRLPPDALDAIERALRDPSAVGGYFRVRFGREPHSAFVAASYDLLRWAGIVYGDATIFVRREIFERLNGFRDDFPIMEDVNFVARMRKEGRVVRLGQVVVPSRRRWERGGRWRAWASWWAIQLLFGLRVPPAFLARMYGDVR